MTVNLSTLKAGDKVKFRNGEVQKVEYVMYDNGVPHCQCTIRTQGRGIAHYTGDGFFWEHCTTDLLDIVEILPAKEASPWKPIELAPKDGTDIIGRYSTWYGNGYCTIVWDKDEEHWFDVDWRKPLCENVTHFVPAFSDK